jgi:hypothetical protein
MMFEVKNTEIFNTNKDYHDIKTTHEHAYEPG